VTFNGREICRVDVAPCVAPVWAKTSKADRVFFARFNNSTRALAEDQAEGYIAAARSK
jgi:hypothetical protein